MTNIQIIFIMILVSFMGVSIFYTELRDKIFGGTTGHARIMGIFSVSGATFVLVCGLLLAPSNIQFVKKSTLLPFLLV